MAWTIEADVVKQQLIKAGKGQMGTLFKDITNAYQRYDNDDEYGRDMSTIWNRLKRMNYKDAIDMVVNYVYKDKTPIKVKQTFAESVRNQFPSLANLRYTNGATSSDRVSLGKSDIDEIESQINSNYQPSQSTELALTNEDFGTGQREHSPEDVNLKLDDKIVNASTELNESSDINNEITPMAAEQSIQIDSDQVISSNTTTEFPRINNSPSSIQVDDYQATSSVDSENEFEIRPPIEPSHAQLFEYRENYKSFKEIVDTLTSIDANILSTIIGNMVAEQKLLPMWLDQLTTEQDKSVNASMLALQVYQQADLMADLAQRLFEQGINIYSTDNFETSANDSAVDLDGAINLLAIQLTDEQRRYLIDWLDLNSQEAEIIIDPTRNLNLVLTDRLKLVRVLDGLKVIDDSQWLNDLAQLLAVPRGHYNLNTNNRSIISQSSNVRSNLRQSSDIPSSNIRPPITPSLNFRSDRTQSNNRPNIRTPTSQSSNNLIGQNVRYPSSRNTTNINREQNSNSSNQRRYNSSLPPLRRNPNPSLPPLRRNPNSSLPPLQRNPNSSLPPLRRNPNPSLPPLQRTVTTITNRSSQNNHPRRRLNENVPSIVPPIRGPTYVPPPSFEEEE